jgi:repressor LexA
MFERKVTMARKSAGISDRHRKIMEFLMKFQDENGYSPSIREIGEHIGVASTSLVDYYLRQLEEREYIERDQHISRSIRVLRPINASIGETVKRTFNRMTEAVNELLDIPVLGRVVAGEPIPVPGSDVRYFDPESSVAVARSLLNPRENVSELFALEVQGESMIDAMINDGDLVIMKPAKEASNGEMVAVWMDDKDETTLKYFYKENNRIRLQPANPTMKPIFVDDPRHLRIMGKVVLVIRQVKGR